MNKVAGLLASYIIEKGVVKEEYREVYEYGFTILLEMVSFVVFSVAVSLYLHMVLEGILFFVIFILLRSYAGGLHLNNFYACFVLSCLTLWGILLMTQNVYIPITVIVIAFLILEVCVYALYPVESTNREVDSVEDRYFKKRLETYLAIHLVLVLVCAGLKYDRCLVLIVATYVMIVITMVIGKCNFKKQK